MDLKRISVVSPIPHVLVTGPLGLVDANAVHFLQACQARHGAVAVRAWATFAPAVGQAELDYVLGQLACVDRVLPPDAVWPKHLPIIEFSTEFIALARNRLETPVPDDDPKPPSLSIDELLNPRPAPLVLLSGCFDLIHAGHIHLIELAARYGSRPIAAALTTKAISVQPKNQGRRRPFWTMEERLTLLQALRTRPRVLFFDGPDCLKLIARLRPDVWVKEKRDRGRAIVEQESRLVETLGGRAVWEDCAMFQNSSTAIGQAVLHGCPS